MVVHPINPYIQGPHPPPKVMGDKPLKVIGLAGEYRATSKSGMLVNLALAMKNTMDWMYDKHVGGKVFGLMSTLGGVTNANTLNHMRISLRWLHGWPVPEQLAIGHVKEAFDEAGELVDDELRQRLSSVVNSVLTAAKKLR